MGSIKVGLILLMGLWFVPAFGQPEQAYLDSLLGIKINTASKHWQTAAEAPAAVTIITSNDIRRFGFRTIDEALGSVRGFYISNDRNYTYVGVRGFSRPGDYNNRIQLLLNGHMMNENFYGSSYFGNEFSINMESIDHIEIVRGPGSALYGSGAVFAVINIITKSGDEIDGFQALAETGTLGRKRGGVMFGRLLESGLDVSLSGQFGESDGADLYFPEFDTDATNYGIASDLDWEKFSQLQFAARWQDLNLQGAYSYRSKGIPTGAYGMDFNNPRARTADASGFVELQYDGLLSHDKGLLGRISIDTYRYDGDYPYGTLFSDANRGLWYSGEVRFRWDINPIHRVVAGAEGRHNVKASYEIFTDGVPEFRRDVPYSLISLYLQDELQVLDDLSLTFGIRWERNSLTTSSLTPRAAAVYNPGSLGTFKFTFGDAYRSPNVYELYYYDEALLGLKRNPSLRAEKIRALELIWEKKVGDFLHGSVSIYENRISNLIDQVLDPADSLLFFQNIASVRARGFEWQIDARLSSSVYGYISHSMQETRDLQSDKGLTNSPANVFRLGVVLPVVNPVSLGVEAQYQSGRRTLGGSRTVPFWIANAFLRLTLMESGQNTDLPILNNVSMSLLAKNIFDRPYATPGAFEHMQDSIEQDGRTLGLILQVTL